MEHKTKKISTRYGYMAVPAEDDLVAKSLHLYGEWAQEEIDLLSRFIPASGIVIDVGAFIGSHARAFSNVVGAKGAVFAYEGNPVSVDYLKKNAELGAIGNIVVYDGMLSDNVSERYSLFVPKGNLGGSRLMANSAPKDDQIHSSRLDDYGFEHVDFLKIDVEGMEVKVVKGAETLISKARPIIFAEVNSIHAGNELLSWAQPHGYVSYGVISKAFNRENFKGNERNIFSNAAETGFLLIPNEKMAAYQRLVTEENLPHVRTGDDLALLLLHKPQYPYEILNHSNVADSLGVRYGSPVSRDQEARILRLVGGKKNLIREKNELKREISSIRRQTMSLQEGLRKTNEKAMSLKEDLKKTNEKKAELQRLLRMSEAKNIEILTQILRMKNSASWKITAPLRHARTLVRSPKNCFSRIFIGVQYRVLKKSFSPDQYLKRNPDVAASGVDPLLHYITHGRKEKRAVRHADESVENYVVAGDADSDVVNRDVSHISVSVILPVYKGIGLTEECIDSAIQGIIKHPNCRLVIINDCSPEQGMDQMLERKKAQYGHRVVLYKNETNLGFVKTVNFGMKATGSDDVVLLNSDAITPGNWLQPLISAAYVKKSVATVTPLSNNTTITAFPHPNTENPLPFGEGINAIQSCFDRESYPSVIAPTGVGFCMYVKRMCIDDVGLFDEESFGRGYGEENDFCQRAKKSGWLNVITPNLYVYHAGGVSFGAEKSELVVHASKMMEQLHPEYHVDVQSFVISDPLRVWRLSRVIDLIAFSDKKKIIYISHGLGGGVKQHIDELVEFLSDHVIPILIIPSRTKGALDVFLSDLTGQPDFTVSCPNQLDDLLEILKACRVEGVHFHHFMNVPEELWSIDRKLGVRSIITIHDYYVLSSNPPLTDIDGVFPKKYSDDLGLVRGGGRCATLRDVSRWRQVFRPVLERAEYVVYPSHATQKLYNIGFSLSNALVVPHLERGRAPAPLVRSVKRDGEITIGVVGALSKEKGADLVEKVSQYFSSRNSRVRIKVIGYGYRPLDGVTWTGKYNSEELLDLIKSNRVDLLWYPSRCPETYSYVLSYGLASGLPIVAPEIGAFPERLMGRPNTMLFDHLATVDAIGESLSSFIEFSEKPVEFQVDASARKCAESFYQESYLSTFMSTKTANEVVTRVSPDVISRLVKCSPVMRPKKARMRWLFSTIKWVYWHPRMKFARNLVPVRVAKRVSRTVFGNDS